jgi:hypothetical protein
MRRALFDPPTFEELQCVMTWPPGTVGYQQEKQLIETLLKLCAQHGFGRMAQIMQDIEIIWRNPDKAKEFQQAQKDRFEVLKDTIDYYRNKPPENSQ